MLALTASAALVDAEHFVPLLAAVAVMTVQVAATACMCMEGAGEARSQGRKMHYHTRGYRDAGQERAHEHRAPSQICEALEAGQWATSGQECLAPRLRSAVANVTAKRARL